MCRFPEGWTPEKIRALMLNQPWYRRVSLAHRGIAPNRETGLRRRRTGSPGWTRRADAVCPAGRNGARFDRTGEEGFAARAPARRSDGFSGTRGGGLSLLSALRRLPVSTRRISRAAPKQDRDTARGAEAAGEDRI